MERNNGKLIDIVKRNLRSKGYRVKTVSKTFGCDLIVQDTYRVIVVRKGKLPDVLPERIDCFAIVGKTIAGNPDIAYHRGGAVPLTTRPHSIFGLSKS